MYLICLLRLEIIGIMIFLWDQFKFAEIEQSINPKSFKTFRFAIKLKLDRSAIYRELKRMLQKNIICITLNKLIIELLSVK